MIGISGRLKNMTTMKMEMNMTTMKMEMNMTTMISIKMDMIRIHLHHSAI